MHAALLALAGVLGGWLVAAPLVLGHATSSTWYIDPALGLVTITLAAAGVRWSNASIAAWLVALVGLVLVVVGFSGLIGSPSARLDEGLVGLLLALLGLIATQLTVPTSAVAVDKDGRPLSEIMTIRRKGDLVAMRAKLLGSMPATIYITPEELWKVVGLIDAGVAFALPRLLVVGWWRSRHRAPPADASLPGGPVHR